MNESSSAAEPGFPAPPAALVSTNLFRWLTIFGPGAIIASLTIGTGELIFSSRGGALFGYRILFLFTVISICKWILVFSTARHMVLSGVHPLRRWLELPLGPRGWLPAVFFLFAVTCIPIWVSFHSSVIGDLIAGLTNTKYMLNGAVIHAWGALLLCGVTAIALAGGYESLEKLQLLVVALMLLAVSVAMVLLRPDWIELLLGFVWPRPLEFPEWLLNDPRPALQRIASQPIWVEASLYVGVIGGASYDYLAYTSFLRDKRWGLASTEQPLVATEDQWPQLRQWIRAPLVDCTLSFVIVMAFSTVFVASGWLVLGPQRQIPGDGNFLEHQAQFVTQIHPWLFGLYVAGTMCAMLGTLYGTLEVAPAILREAGRLLEFHSDAEDNVNSMRRVALLWTSSVAMAVLVASFVVQVTSGADKPPGLTQLLIPANLFTGVLSCGIICLLNPWIDRCLPDGLRPPTLLKVLNLVVGAAFLLLGVKGYWDLGGANALAILAGTIAAGWLLALGLGRKLVTRVE